MAGIYYATGVNRALQYWESDPFTFVLADTTTTVVDEPGALYLADVLTGGHELVDTAYARQTMTSPVRSVTTVPSAIRLTCDNPDFGTLTEGGVAGWLLLTAVVTNDADSPLVAAYPVGYTADGTRPALFAPTAAVAITFVCS